MGELIDFDTLAHTNGPPKSGRLLLDGCALSGSRTSLRMEFPPRRMLLAPWLPIGGLVILGTPLGGVSPNQPCK